MISLLFFWATSLDCDVMMSVPSDSSGRKTDEDKKPSQKGRASFCQEMDHSTEMWM